MKKFISIPLPTGGNKQFKVGDTVALTYNPKSKFAIERKLAAKYAGRTFTVTSTDSYGVYFTVPNGNEHFAENRFTAKV